MDTHELSSSLHPQELKTKGNTISSRKSNLAFNDTLFSLFPFCRFTKQGLDSSGNGHPDMSTCGILQSIGSDLTRMKVRSDLNLNGSIHSEQTVSGMKGKENTPTSRAKVNGAQSSHFCFFLTFNYYMFLHMTVRLITMIMITHMILSLSVPVGGLSGELYSRKSKQQNKWTYNKC